MNREEIRTLIGRSKAFISDFVRVNLKEIQYFDEKYPLEGVFSQFLEVFSIQPRKVSNCNAL
jgi:hypothetical protein